MKKAYLVVLIILVGCMQGGIPEVPRQFVARMHDAAGNEIGLVGFSQYFENITIGGGLASLPPGMHGFHIHAEGKCDLPDFKSAGAHYNPAGKKHGLKNPEGPHAGDLPNIEVGQDGIAHFKINAPLTLDDVKNRALVVHEKADDEMTDPSGNSGVRIACGVIE